MFLSGQVNIFSQLVLGQVDFCNISTALLSVHNGPLLTFISGFGRLVHGQKMAKDRKTVEIEPKITVDFNSAICHSLC